MSIPSLQQLLEAGVHFGHQVRRGNPRMRQFIYGQRDGVHIIDLTLSEKYLKQAAEYVEELGERNASIIFVGTKKQARPIVEELAEKVGAYYLTERWIGGFLTNFEEISKNIKKLKELKDQKEKKILQKYTKKEQLLIDRRMIKLQRDFKGVMDLTQVPEAIFVVDAASDDVAVKEAKRKGVVVVAIADSNADPNMIDYPIPGNDDAIKSITILTETIANAYAEGKAKAGKIVKAAEAKEAKKASKKAKEPIEVETELPEVVAAVEEEIEKKVVKESERVVA